MSEISSHRTMPTPTLKQTTRHKLQKAVKQDNARFIERLFSALNSAALSRAEQVNLQPEKSYTLVSLVKDGQSIPIQKENKDFHGKIVRYIRKQTGISDLEKNRHHTTWLSSENLGQQPVRVTTLPSFYGTKIILNPVHDFDPSLNFDSIGMQLGTQYTVRKHLKNSRGLILIIGEDPRALKDTFYAMAQNINNRRRNITTLEDVIDQNIPAVNQIETGHINISQAEMITRLRTQDVDAIFVENIHKRKTLEAATQAALQGHLVVATMHAESANEAIYKLKDISLDDRITSNVLELIIEQKTVPGAHPFAAEPKFLNKQDLKNLKNIIKPYRLLEIIRKETGAEIASLKEIAFFKESINTALRLPIRPVYLFGLTEFDNTARDIFATAKHNRKITNIINRQPFLSITEDACLKALQGMTTLEAVFATLDKKE